MGWACALAVVGLIIAGIAGAINQAAALEKAKKAYEAALALLSADPENNQKRIAALEAGRAYAGLARQKAGSKGIAIFDEVALQNDLSARLGKGAHVAHQALSTGGQGSTSRVEQLTRLGELRDKGVLTPEEFETEKRRILAG